jgi:hypothetical protein
LLMHRESHSKCGGTEYKIKQVLTTIYIGMTQKLQNKLWSNKQQWLRHASLSKIRSATMSKMNNPPLSD